MAPSDDDPPLQLYAGIEVGPGGELLVGGLRALDLARIFGTPLYVYVEDAIRWKAREYLKELRRVSVPADVAYASKAYLSLRMARIAYEEGLWLDVASAGEFFLAMKAGFPPERILFHGNNKSPEELKMAIKNGVGRIVADNLPEIKRIQGIASALGRTQPVLIRVAPGIDPHTHKALATGRIDSKFGIPVYRGAHIEAVRLALKMRNVRFMGFHCHVGSQIFERRWFELAGNTMAEIYDDCVKATGVLPEECDLGGGLGVAYVPEDKELSVKDYCEALVGSFRERLSSLGLPCPRIFIEPGRSIVAQAGITLYKVGTIKRLPSGQRLLAVDGGMADNPRPMLYSAKYRCLLARQAREGQLSYRVVGKNCEEGDTLIEEAFLPLVKTGDILAVMVTGAYHYSMSSNYNALPRPAVVHVWEGRAFPVVRRQTYRDLLDEQIEGTDRLALASNMGPF
ncbi:MAG: diaminopimelate decarboxylase [Firmicutes bacterium]|nr:diaminopimelate decarboxylase [Candidatus Fermentithermobacillaceae bacterium]